MLQVENVDKETQVNAGFISIYLLLLKTTKQNKIECLFAVFRCSPVGGVSEEDQKTKTQIKMSN